MLHRNPEVSQVIAMIHEAEPKKNALNGWVIFLIVEATISGFGLIFFIVRTLLSKRRIVPAYLEISSESGNHEEKRPFKDSLPTYTAE